MTNKQSLSVEQITVSVVTHVKRDISIRFISTVGILVRDLALPHSKSHGYGRGLGSLGRKASEF